MTKRLESLLLWSPRVLGIGTCLFLSLFAADAFGGGKTFLRALPDFLVHVSPMLAMLLIVALSWRRPWVGGLVFTALAVVYAVFVRRHPDWILAISGPLLLVGVLFLWSWRRPRGAGLVRS